MGRRTSVNSTPSQPGALIPLLTWLSSPSTDYLPGAGTGFGAGAGAGLGGGGGGLYGGLGGGGLGGLLMILLKLEDPLPVESREGILRGTSLGAHTWGTEVSILALHPRIEPPQGAWRSFRGGAPALPPRIPGEVNVNPSAPGILTSAGLLFLLEDSSIHTPPCDHKGSSGSAFRIPSVA
jgi:hypothetical protein